MQIAVITGPTHEIALKRIHLANKIRDGLELRLDLFKGMIDTTQVRELVESSTKKVILTLRKRCHGGGFLGTEEKRQKILLELLECGPQYIDIESDTHPEFFQVVHELYPKCKIISSYHDFSLTPRDLEKIFKGMESKNVYAYKVCTTANSFADAYKMLRFIQKKTTDQVKFIGICMGEYGRITRRDGIKAGNYLNYTILHNRDSCAPGLAIKES